MAITNEMAESLLQDLVSISSPSHQEQSAVMYLVQWMAEQAYDQTFVDEAGNAVGIMGTGSRTIVLLGHIDTFGGAPPVVRDGRLLYGRGSVDAKGPLCCFAVAAAQAELPPDLRIVVIGAVEEEAASSKGARFVATQYQPEMCIIGEPSQWDRITLAYKGRLVLHWRWEGPLAHSAASIISPPEHAVNYWLRVQDYVNTINDAETTLFGRLDATLQMINSGQDGAYGWAEATVGFRLPPGIDPTQLATELADPHATITISGREHAYVADKDTPLSRALRRAIREQGGTPRFVHKTGTSDMNVVGPIWNCPILAYGPGDSALDHTPDEHIDLDEYLRAIAVLRDALQRI